MSYLVVGGMSGLGAGWGDSITSGAAGSVAVLNAKAKAAAASAQKSKSYGGASDAAIGIGPRVKPKDDDDDSATANQVIGIASQVAQGYNAYQAERRAELEAQRPVYVPQAQPAATALPSWAPWAAAGAAAFLALFAVASSRR